MSAVPQGEDGLGPRLRRPPPCRARRSAAHPGRPRPAGRAVCAPVLGAQAQRAWEDFFKKFPEMRAYELTLDPNRADGKSMEEQLQEVLEPMLDKQSGEWEKPSD